ncbi:MAG: N-acetylmuramoyl-L-alanine amidase [Gemmatimonadota bacterium]
MIAGTLLISLALAGATVAGGPGAPMAVVVSTAGGDVRVPIRADAATGPVLASPLLLRALGGTSRVDGAWAEVEVAHQSYRFLLGAPIFSLNGVVRPLVGVASVRRDTLFLPLQFVTAVLPSTFASRFRYEPQSAKLVELVGRAVTTLALKKDAGRLPNGLRRGHVVTVDPGHGGVDPGNPGLYFPRGLKEKDVTLQMGLLVRQELLKRGIGVIMTRTTDTLINLRQRGSYCSNRCDLFVSLHVNSLARRAGFNRVRGFETYYVAQAKTEDASRVAKMENDAVRFEAPDEREQAGGGLGFILKDLQLNEHMREAVRLAELIQSHLEETHSGPNLGVKEAPFMVLTTARRPAVLVEMGYSTNPSDAAVMTESRSQRDLAGSIADAVVAYLLEYEQRVAGSPAETVVGEVDSKIR